MVPTSDGISRHNFGKIIIIIIMRSMATEWMDKFLHYNMECTLYIRAPCFLSKKAKCTANCILYITGDPPAFQRIRHQLVQCNLYQFINLSK